VVKSEEKIGDDGKPYTEITGIDLFEVSVVGLPAQPEARFELVNKSFNMAITEEIEKRKEGKEMAEEKKEDAQKKDLEKYEAEDKAIASKVKEEKVEDITTSDDTTTNTNISDTDGNVDTTIKEAKSEGEKVEEKQDENVGIEKKDKVEKEEVAEAKTKPVENVEESSEKEAEEVEKTEEKPAEEKLEEILTTLIILIHIIPIPL